MRSEAYFHVTAENEEEYQLLIHLGEPWLPPPTGFMNRIDHTVFLIAPEAMPRILRQMANVKSPRWCVHGELDNEKVCTEAWNRTCPIYIHKQLSGDGMEISKPLEEPEAERPKLTIDVLGLVCEHCKEGTYHETSINDDMNGTLHCSSCNRQVKRHQEREMP